MHMPCLGDTNTRTHGAHRQQGWSFELRGASFGVRSRARSGPGRMFLRVVHRVSVARGGRRVKGAGAGQPGLGRWTRGPGGRGGAGRRCGRPFSRRR